MELGAWGLVWAFCGAVALAVVLGYWYDRRHAARSYFRSLPVGARDLARYLSGYYATVRAPEW